MRNFPPEWKTEIKNNIINKHRSFFMAFLKPETDISNKIDIELDKFLSLEFNKQYFIPNMLLNEFKSFCISITIHQICKNIHPLTCGVNSNHNLLVPRIDLDKTLYLICPSCGYIQKSVPILFS